MHVIHEDGSRPIKAWVELVDATERDYFGNETPVLRPNIEDSALKQLKNLARLPFIDSNGVAAMPDVHMGVGASVGTVIATNKAIIPSAVGVDIGCGMNAVRLSLKGSQLPDSLLAIRHQIERDIPLGAGGAYRSQSDVELRHGRAGFHTASLQQRTAVVKAVGAYERAAAKAAEQLGTLGSGNHFIEICLDESDDVWVMLHSGSRGVGNMIGRYFIEKAKRRMEQYFITLPDGDLAYLPEDTDDFKDYVEAVKWAQDYALENRRLMMEIVIAALRRHMGVEFTTTSEAINCHHNYVERESHFGRNLWVTRKGAIRARSGDLGIIPGSMGQRSYIVKGKGNVESYCSCSHGAGRTMSRAEAKRRFTLADLAAQTDGVECRKDADVLDEIPGAYKRLDLVMDNQKDLVEVVHTLKAILCVKGA